MTDKVLCPHYNVGYCKDKCSKVHAKIEYTNKHCKKKCLKRQRKVCRYGTECRYKVKNKGEFMHTSDAHETELVNGNFLVDETESQIKQPIVNAAKLQAKKLCF